jgi:acyl-CoA reductase-like NAD-dependent aldehyde dehydrogenase
VLPSNLLERAVWWGYTVDVWIEPGQLPTQGRIYRQPEVAAGQVALVLGAGNVSAIGPLDALHQLLVENAVVLLKLNPVNDYLGSVWAEAFQPLIEAGFWAIASGGAELGSYLCHHPLVERIHITGSHHTFDAIVWGSDRAEAERRKSAREPFLTKPIAAELGCVTPILVVPGTWSAADLSFQARQVASAMAHNASFNCTAAQVLVLAKGWPQRDAFLAQVRQELARIPSRTAYYPGAEKRYGSILERYPQAKPLSPAGEGIVPWTTLPDVPACRDEFILREEAFCGVLAEVSLDVKSAADFLGQATQFANDSLWGTLSCVVLIDPKTQTVCHAEFEQAIAALRYGTIGVNVWTGLGFALGCSTWGAFPGHTLEEIGSGRGVVHNTYLFDRPQKSVVTGSFRIVPTPPWFVTHRNLHRLGKRFTAFEVSPSWSKLPAVIWEVMRG